jgi:hypothetical protein
VLSRVFGQRQHDGNGGERRGTSQQSVQAGFRIYRAASLDRESQLVLPSKKATGIPDHPRKAEGYSFGERYDLRIPGDYAVSCSLHRPHFTVLHGKAHTGCLPS